MAVGKLPTHTLDGNGYTYEASHGRPLGAKNEPYFPCASCSEPFFVSDMREWEGKLYGVPCGDYQDKVRTRQREERAAQGRYPDRQTRLIP